MVLLNIFSSENKLQLKNNNRLSINVGVQSNERMENEGSGKISLNMHLLTFQYLLKLEKQVSTRSRLIISHLGSFEGNTNFGARKIVPDAYLQEANLSAFIETVLRPGLILENGAGLGEKWIKTYFTPNVNGPEAGSPPLFEICTVLQPIQRNHLLSICPIQHKTECSHRSADSQPGRTLF